MLRLSTAEAGVLARVAQYDKLPVEDRERLLNGVGMRQEAKEIGLVLLGKSQPSTDEIARAASRIKKWADRNRARRTVARATELLAANY